MTRKLPKASLLGGLVILAACLAGPAWSLAHWHPNGTVQALTVSGSTLYLGGSFSALTGPSGAVLPRQNLAAIDINTGSPLSWNPGADGAVLALALKGGSVLAGGQFLNAGGQARARLAELDASGSTGWATAWNPGADATVRAMALGGTTLFVGGDFGTLGGQARARLGELDASGSTGWATSFNRPVAGGAALVRALVCDGSVLLVAGEFTSIDGSPRNGLAKLNATSGSVLGFDPASALSAPRFNALDLAGSTLFTAGEFSGVLGGAGATRGAGLQTSSGSAWWTPQGLNAEVRAVLVLPSGRVILGGDFSSAAGQTRALAALMDGSSAAALDSLGLAGSTVNAIKIAGPWIALGGAFTQAGYQPHGNLALIDLNALSPPALGASAPGAFHFMPHPLRLSRGSRAGFHMRGSGKAGLRVFSPAGGLVLERTGTFAAGPASFPLDGRGLSRGLYLARLKLDYDDGSSESPPVFKLVVLP